MQDEPRRAELVPAVGLAAGLGVGEVAVLQKRQQLSAGPAAAPAPAEAAAAFVQPEAEAVRTVSRAALAAAHTGSVAVGMEVDHTG